MARDPETIQRDIEKARAALAENLDVLSERASPRRLADSGRQRVQVRLQDPRIRYGLIAVGALIAVAVLILLPASTLRYSCAASARTCSRVAVAPTSGR